MENGKSKIGNLHRWGCKESAMYHLWLHGKLIATTDPMIQTVRRIPHHECEKVFDAADDCEKSILVAVRVASDGKIFIQKAA